MNRNSLLSIGIALLLLGTILFWPKATKEPNDYGNGEFHWIPDRITASIEIDDQYLKKGQYLLLNQDIETGWTMSKFDIPENWKVDKIIFDGPDLVLQLAEGQTYFVNPENFGRLSSDILSLPPQVGEPPDSDLAAIWNKLAIQRLKRP